MQVLHAFAAAFESEVGASILQDFPCKLATSPSVDAKRFLVVMCLAYVFANYRPLSYIHCTVYIHTIVQCTDFEKPSQQLKVSGVQYKPREPGLDCVPSEMVDF